MNNDLISRSYLKNLPFERVIHTDFGETAIPIEEIENAPTASPKEICIANIHFDKEQLREIVDNAITRCKDCKHQKKYWHEDKRMKEKGYWIYGCNLIDDSFVGTPVWGGDNQFCSSAKRKGE